jgi:hypothetical protein
MTGSGSSPDPVPSIIERRIDHPSPVTQLEHTVLDAVETEVLDEPFDPRNNRGARRLLHGYDDNSAVFGQILTNGVEKGRDRSSETGLQVQYSAKNSLHPVAAL